MDWAIRYDHGAVGTITLSNPERLNAFTGEGMLALRGVLEEMAADRAVRAVLVTGAGQAFCAGGDLNTFDGEGGEPLSGEQVAATMREMTAVVELLSDMPKLTVAAVNGPCAGAGLSLALACDLRVSARSAVFLSSFVRVGQSGDYGQAWLLNRQVGAGWARRLQLLSERIDAETALRIGLIEELVEDDELQHRSLELASAAIEMAPSAVAAIKANLADASVLPLADYLDAEGRRFVANMAGEDSKEAVAAFLEHREPRYG
jgi:2-(1,2-epoxy-1,2-dihydrophenyl)acetyl-CoA isomerase